MLESSPGPSLVGLLTLSEVRGYIRRSHGISLAVFIAVAYALGSMLIGGMLVFGRFSGGYSVLLLWGNALGLQSWNYPGFLIEAPWGFIELPLFATASMAAVAVGVGLGMAVAVLLGVQIIRERKSASGRPAATGTIAGLTPALIALVTLGACCSTTAAATAGVALVSASSGSSTSNLLYNNWFLGVFQIVVVFVALIAQELLLRVYGNLFGTTDPAFAPREEEVHHLDRRAFVTGALRAGLLAAGLTWALAVLASWTTIAPSNALAALWFNWVFEHWLLGGMAVLVALSPRSVRRWLLPSLSTVPGLVFRGSLLLGAWSLGTWVPPPFAGWGVEGFGNELLGLFGFSASFGAVAPVFPWGIALALRWGFQYVLLTAFAAAVALWPKATMDWLSESNRPAPTTPGAAPATSSSSPIPLDFQ
ncbi:MAG: hypothetical protein ABSA63_05325 [Thermoplasmata archaeon]